MYVCFLKTFVLCRWPDGSCNVSDIPGVLTSKQLQTIREDWVPLLTSAPALENTSELLLDPEWSQFRESLGAFASGG
jgi:hypothetical protein